MGVFNLKYRDTLPVLEVDLTPPSTMSAADLSAFLEAADAIALHIRLSDGTRLTRVMELADAEERLLRYAWVESDWAPKSGTPVDGAYPVGGLVVTPGSLGPTGYVLTPGAVEHVMEYEVLGEEGRLTFPNGGFGRGGYDTLRIVPDIGQVEE